MVRSLHIHVIAFAPTISESGAVSKDLSMWFGEQEAHLEGLSNQNVRIYLQERVRGGGFWCYRASWDAKRHCMEDLQIRSEERIDKAPDPSRYNPTQSQVSPIKETPLNPKPTFSGEQASAQSCRGNASCPPSSNGREAHLSRSGSEP